MFVGGDQIHQFKLGFDVLDLEVQRRDLSLPPQNACRSFALSLVPVNKYSSVNLCLKIVESERTERKVVYFSRYQFLERPLLRLTRPPARRVTHHPRPGRAIFRHGLLRAE